MNENEFFAATANELNNGEMKEVQWNETKIVLARIDDEYYAVGGVCPHYKAPLAKGALCGTRLYCPWHHSSFDITNGNLLEPPALDGLPRYNVRVENDNIFIAMPVKNEVPESKTTYGSDDRTFVIIGGGAAGCMAAETLRSNGFKGKVVMITKEDKLPYDRTALSKKYMSGKKQPDELPLRDEDFFKQHQIEIAKQKAVTNVEADKKTIVFDDGSSLSYDALLVATGGEPDTLSVEGANFNNVFTLRSATNAEHILRTAKNAKKACIIGASFIGMETAASLTTLGLSVTVVAKEKMPFESNFGYDIGKIFFDMHTKKGVTIKTEAELEKISGTGKAETVILKSGVEIETDLVIMGIGVHPKTDFLQGLTLHEKDKSVMVDDHLLAAPHLFVAGDIARFPDAKTGADIRIEHWRVAQQHGRLAALNMLEKNHSVKEIVPFFWTNQYEKRLSYVGHAEDWDDIVVDGDIEKQKFLAFYVTDDKVMAVASMNRDIESNQMEDMMRTGGMITLNEAKEKLKL